MPPLDDLGALVESAPAQSNDDSGGVPSAEGAEDADSASALHCAEANGEEHAEDTGGIELNAGDLPPTSAEGHVGRIATRLH